jgi:hypothetical protein
MARIITSISGGSRPLTQQTLLPVQMAWMCSLLFNQGARQRQCSVDVVTLMLLILRKLLCCRQMAAD